MYWQLFLVLYFVATVIADLLRRKLGKTIPEHNKVVNAFFFVCIHYPIGIVAALISGFDPGISQIDFLILASAGIAFPITNLLAFRASKDIGAGLFSIISNFSPVVTIVLASLLLSEVLNLSQIIAIIILISSALAVTIPNYKTSNNTTKISIVIAVTSIVLNGLTTVYEAWMLDRIGFASYLVYGWGWQTLWMAIIARPERHMFKELLNKQYLKPVAVMSLTRSLKGFSLLAALSLSGSAALVGAFKSFTPVIVVIAGALVLNEHGHIKLKIIAAIFGSIGLLILSIS